LTSPFDELCAAPGTGGSPWLAVRAVSPGDQWLASGCPAALVTVWPMTIPFKPVRSLLIVLAAMAATALAHPPSADAAPGTGPGGDLTATTASGPTRVSAIGATVGPDLTLNSVTVKAFRVETG